MNLDDLNDDVLLLIFENCSNHDLYSLIFVCKRFGYLVEKFLFYKRTLDLLISGHRGNTIACRRTLNVPTYANRLKLNYNWRQGRFEELQYFQRHTWYPTKILLEKDFFYMTLGGQIRCHQRMKKTYLAKKPRWKIGDIKDPDILCLTKKDDLIFAGNSIGEILLYSHNEFNDRQLVHPVESLNSIDFIDDIFITTAKNETKIWSLEKELGVAMLNEESCIDQGFYRIKIDPKACKFVAGKFHDVQKTALKLVDLETNKIETLNSRTISIYDAIWKDENCILTGNFDTTFRLFDCRTNRDELIWEDPFDSSIYSLDYDGLYGVVCGMKYNGRVNLYDLRVPTKVIQMFFPSRPKTETSPVYSVACDATQLFLATGYNVRIFNYDVIWPECKDYSNIFKKIIS